MRFMIRFATASILLCAIAAKGTASSSGQSQGWQVSSCPSTFTAAIANQRASGSERGQQDQSMMTRHYTVPPGSRFLGHPITALKEISYRDDFGAMATNFELMVSATFERVVQTAAGRFRRSPTAAQLASSATFIGERGYHLHVIYRESGVQISCAAAEF